VGFEGGGWVPPRVRVFEEDFLCDPAVPFEVPFGVPFVNGAFDEDAHVTFGRTSWYFLLFL